jgi:hypothetical protein
MKFYVVNDTDTGEVVGCELSLKTAREEAGKLTDAFSISAVEVAVNAETVRRLLGNLGGYAQSIKHYDAAK